MKHIRVAIALALTAAISAFAADAVHFPEFSSVTRERITATVIKQDRVALVAVRVTLAFPHGLPAYDPASAALYLHAIKHGSKQFPGAQWLTNLDLMGAEVDEHTQPFAIGLATEVRAADAPAVIKQLLDGLFSPELPAAPVMQERQRLTAELTAEGDRPQGLLNAASALAWYGVQHPYGLSAEGTPKQMTAAMPKLPLAGGCWRLLITVVGDTPLTPEMLLAAGAAVAPQSAACAKFTPPAPPAPRSGRRVVIVDQPEAQQTHLRLIMAGPADRYSPLKLANIPFASTFTSRLIRKLRTELGLTYGVNAFLDQRPLTSAYAITSFTKVASTGDFLSELHKQIALAKKPGLTAEEIAKGKALMKAETPQNWERYGSLAATAEHALLDGQPADYSARLVNQAQGFSDVQTSAALASALVPERSLLVLVGPAAKIKAVAAKYGAVEIWTKNQVIEPSLK